MGVVLKKARRCPPKTINKTEVSSKLPLFLDGSTEVNVVRNPFNHSVVKCEHKRHIVHLNGFIVLLKDRKT